MLTLFAKHLHVQVAVSLNPVLVDFDRQRPNESQGALLVWKDADDLGSAFEFLIEPLEHVRALEMLVVLSGQPIKGQRFLHVFFHPRAEPRIFLLPANQPNRQGSTGFLSIASIVEPAQFDQTVVGNLAGQMVKGVA